MCLCAVMLCLQCFVLPSILDLGYDLRGYTCNWSCVWIGIWHFHAIRGSITGYAVRAEVKFLELVTLMSRVVMIIVISSFLHHPPLPGLYL
uniref:Alpha-soluble NSF attachment protein 2-like n=1 Tax=Rhizophora mucronata TaxID=61149 RepID=A0A2P2M703_RHIMU